MLQSLLNGDLVMTIKREMHQWITAMNKLLITEQNLVDNIWRL